MVFASLTEIAVRDLATGKTKWHRALPRAHARIHARWAGDGVIFVAGEYADVKWWNPRTDEQVALGPQAFVKSLRVTRDGARATWVDERGTVYVADSREPDCANPGRPPDRHARLFNDSRRSVARRDPRHRRTYLRPAASHG